MKHIISIDDTTSSGENLLQLLHDFARFAKGVEFLNDIPEVEDAELLSKMKKGLRSGIAPKDEALKTLQAIAEK